MSEGEETYEGELKLMTDPQTLENLQIGLLDWMEKRLTDQIEEYLLELGRNTNAIYMNEKLAEFVGTHVKRNFDFDERVFCRNWNTEILLMMREAKEALGIVGERERTIAVRDVSNKMAVGFLEQVRTAALRKKEEIAANPAGEINESDVVLAVTNLVFYFRRAFGIAKKEREKAGKKPTE